MELNSDVYKLEKDAGTLYSDPKQRPIMEWAVVILSGIRQLTRNHFPKRSEH